MRLPKAMALFAGAFALLLALADAPGERPAAGPQSDIAVLVSHGYHSGIILDRAEIDEIARRDGLLALAAVLERFADHGRLEVGWGDENFYRNVARLELATVPHALRALFLPGNAAVLHVVGFSMAPERAFPSSRILHVPLVEGGLAKIVHGIEASLIRNSEGGIIDLGPGLYGKSRFFRAGGQFSVLHVCNHWIAGLLRAAGLRINRVLAVLPAGLFFDLEWRSGAREGTARL